MTTLGSTVRRSISRTLALCLPFLGCATTGPAGSSSSPVEPAFQDPPPRAGSPALLIAMPNSPDFLDVRRSLVAEVRKNFNVSTLLVTRETSVAEVSVAIERFRPVCAVLMNNNTLGLFQAYETAHPDKPALPTIVVMASFLEDIRAKLRRATGISYEVPGVTAFINLREILETPIRRVGVVFRPPYKRFIERQQNLAARERIALVGREVPVDFSAADLRQALRALIREEKVDALWMLNDNLLVRDVHFLDETWRAELRVAPLPLVVGVSNLVDPASPLGTLAVVPDHEALGLQAGNLVFDLADGGWQAERHPVDSPLSVKTIVDLKQARNHFRLRPDAINRIDKALE
ncbi:MAG: hypothetical protein JXP73_06490 [Deltaproteobacteria bacterium]|nr:hypothetical protein [Deltaproteobacteria bacterium]